MKQALKIYHYIHNDDRCLSCLRKRSNHGNSDDDFNENNIRPTNAEVTDVGNAILRGCDAIMTSDETTMGKYPVETIQMMNTICGKVEK